MNLNIIFDSNAAMDSPVGTINVFARQNKLVGLSMGGPAITSSGKSATLDAAIAQLREYFDGARTEFELEYELDGTDFQKAVWQQIDTIPFGQTLTYADIAARIGKPLAARAVGGAVGANPLALIVPCHRVLGASGRITGYSGGDGLPTKRILLELEQIESKP
ncbi:MAG: hypothetical protein RL605_188 [Actinomycetota bacterium]|jgi:methylated-DNA-[protein]-cysteine S-methyltransferase